MPTDRISPPSSLIDSMRAIARDRAAAAKRGGNSAVIGPPSGTPPAPKNVHQIGELRQRLRALALRINVDDAQSLASARAPALREILLWEFGNDFRKDSQFLPTVDAISQALDTDPSFQQRFVALITDLQKKS
ncbi:MAG: hypothetical protein ABI114_01785 [Rhodanobacter sp.]